MDTPSSSKSLPTYFTPEKLVQPLDKDDAMSEKDGAMSIEMDVDGYPAIFAQIIMDQQSGAVAGSRGGEAESAATNAAESATGSAATTAAAAAAGAT